MTTNQPKTYDQALKESFAEYVAKTPGQSAYMKMDFDAGFAAGWNAALHDRERNLRERTAIAAMQGILARTHLPVIEAGEVAVSYADALINQLNTPQS